MEKSYEHIVHELDGVKLAGLQLFHTRHVQESVIAFHHDIGQADNSVQEFGLQCQWQLLTIVTDQDSTAADTFAAGRHDQFGDTLGQDGHAQVGEVLGLVQGRHLA